MSAMEIEAIKSALSAHIMDEVLLRKEPLDPNEDLFAAGFDSMSLSRVLVFVEERLGVAIPDSDVVIEEVSTLEKLARFVKDYAEKANGKS